MKDREALDEIAEIFGRWSPNYGSPEATKAVMEVHEIVRATGRVTGRDVEDPWGKDESCEVTTPSVEIVIDLTNAAFDDGDECDELARILRRLAGQIQGGHLPHKLMDMNGNTVGKVVRRG